MVGGPGGLAIGLLTTTQVIWWFRWRCIFVHLKLVPYHNFCHLTIIYSCFQMNLSQFHSGFFFLSIHTSDNRWRHMICLSWYWEWNSILPFVRVKYSIFSFNIFFNYPQIGVVSCVPSDSCVAASLEISFWLCGPHM